MYRILKVKKGRPQYKNVMYLYLTHYPSKFFVNLLAKKVLHTRPKFFSLLATQSAINNICYKLSHKIEFNKNHTELYLTVTGACFKKTYFDLYNKSNPLRKINTNFFINFI